MFLHLCGSCRAVDADHIWFHCRERTERRTNFRADQHAAGGLDCYLDLDRDISSLSCHRASTGLHRSLDLQQVHTRLDEEQINATSEQATSLFGV